MSEKAMLKHDTEKSFIFNFTTLEANRIGFTLSFGDAASPQQGVVFRFIQ